MSKILIDELEIRLKAPVIVLEKIVNEKVLPKVFARAAWDELKKAQAIVTKLKKQGKVKS
jgi:hypothetical protein